LCVLRANQWNKFSATETCSQQSTSSRFNSIKKIFHFTLAYHHNLHHHHKVLECVELPILKAPQDKPSFSTKQKSYFLLIFSSRNLTQTFDFFFNCNFISIMILFLFCAIFKFRFSSSFVSSISSNVCQ
jgi:hypothetical protein